MQLMRTIVNNAAKEPWRVQDGIFGFLSGKDGTCYRAHGI